MDSNSCFNFSVASSVELNFLVDDTLSDVVVSSRVDLLSFVGAMRCVVYVDVNGSVILVFAGEETTRSVESKL